MFLFIWATVISDFLPLLAKSRLAGYSKTQGYVTQLTHLGVDHVGLQWPSAVLPAHYTPLFWYISINYLCIPPVSNITPASHVI